MIVLVFCEDLLCVLICSCSIPSTWSENLPLIWTSFQVGKKQPQTIWLQGTFFVTYIKGTAEYADKKRRKRNGKPAELVQSVMNILSELLLILLRCNRFRLHRNWCRIKIVVEDFKCSRKQPSDESQVDLNSRSNYFNENYLWAICKWTANKRQVWMLIFSPLNLYRDTMAMNRCWPMTD